MINLARRQLWLADNMQIWLWRLAIWATRRLHQTRLAVEPVVAPVRVYLWVPAVAWLVGMVFGWSIALN